MPAERLQGLATTPGKMYREAELPEGQLQHDADCCLVLDDKYLGPRVGVILP
jgi:hypothetical protein